MTARSTPASSIMETARSIVNGTGSCGCAPGTHFQSSDSAFHRWICASTIMRRSTCATAWWERCVASAEGGHSHVVTTHVSQHHTRRRCIFGVMAAHKPSRTMPLAFPSVHPAKQHWDSQRRFQISNPIDQGGIKAQSNPSGGRRKSYRLLKRSSLMVRVGRQKAPLTPDCDVEVTYRRAKEIIMRKFSG